MNIVEVSAAVIQRQSPHNFSVTETLAMRRDKGSMAGYWEFPGGKREPGESMSHCLIRELQEELSIAVVIDSELGSHVYDSGNRIIKLHGFVVTRWIGDIKLHDHDQMRWLAAIDLHQVQWSPADIPFVKQVRESLT